MFNRLVVKSGDKTVEFTDSDSVNSNDLSELYKFAYNNNKSIVIEGYKPDVGNPIVYKKVILTDPTEFPQFRKFPRKPQNSPEELEEICNYIKSVFESDITDLPYSKN